MPAPASPAGSVRIRGVTKRFGSVVAVDDLDLDVQPGEVLTLLGPSGCGKTTTLRMLAGLEHPDTGTLEISGRTVNDVPPHRRDVNTVFQAYALFPHMTVAENVAYGLRQRKVGRSEIRSRVADALDMVKMAPLANRKPRQLSGGQQQRVALARALINRPSVLLLDEPLGALDRKLREEMQIELKLLQGKVGTTFVFVTHDQSEALSISDRIAVMRDGKVEQLGAPDDIYDEPATAFVAGFIGLQNFFHGSAAEAGALIRNETVVLRTSRPATGLTDGDAALAAVRPESVELTTTAPAESVNAVRGTVAGISHLGDVIQFLVHAGDHDLVARLPRGSAPKLQTGEDTWCRWSADDVLAYPADT